VSLPEADVRSILDTIKDPCSISVGVPLGLVEMGLVTGVVIADTGAVTVELRLTQPGCTFGSLYFDVEIERRLVGLPGVTSVSVERSYDLSWSEASISPSGRRRLSEMRRGRARASYSA
jgi:metal-sulfur cluster biosynthetic enzyme